MCNKYVNVMWEALPLYNQYSSNEMYLIIYKPYVKVES